MSECLPDTCQWKFSGHVLLERSVEKTQNSIERLYLFSYVLSVPFNWKKSTLKIFFSDFHNTNC